jgi:alkylation response protein AidB-like acyl-CoA dehydrogenase
MSDSATKTLTEEKAVAGGDQQKLEPPAVGGAFLVEPVIGDVFTRDCFSEEQREIEGMVREFAREKIAPRCEELAVPNGELTLELMREVGELGLTGIDVPEQYGGMGLDKTTSALVVEALTLGGSASWVVTFSGHVGIGTLPIVFFGDERQKERYLPKLASVEYLGAYALTEPGAGSDIAGLATKARLADDGEAFILSGEKQYITNGGWAHLFIVFADLEGEGNTAFIVERDSEGLSTGAEEHKMGIKGSSTVSLFLDNVRVPKENLLGAPGGGMPIALNSLNVGRFKLGAANLGGCKNLIGVATRQALDRVQFGQPIAFFEAVRRKFADMVARTFLADSAIYRLVGVIDQRMSTLDPADVGYQKKATVALEEYAIEASIGKILGSETMGRVADHAVQIFGGHGFSEEYPAAEAYRDCRIDRIFEGTNEINRMVIYGYYLKKALMEELPLRQAARDWRRPAAPGDGPLAWEIGALEASRRLTVKCLFEAVSRYGQDLRNAQIVGEDLADLAIGYFAASAAINRILRLDEKLRRSSVYRALGRLATATFLEEAWRIGFRLRPLLFAGAYGSRELADLDDLLAALHLPFDPVDEIRVLTDDLYEHGGYHFD